MMHTKAVLLSITFCAAMSGCDREEPVSPVQHAQPFKFTSHLGNSFTAPSIWTASDNGDTYSIKSPDGKAAIHAIMFTAEGSGTINAFRETMTPGLLPAGSSHWKETEWLPIKIGDLQGQKRELVPVPKSGQEWRLYVIDSGRFYYAIVLNATEDSMLFNGEFFEQVVCSFQGVR